MPKSRSKEEKNKSPLSRHFSAGGAVFRERGQEVEWLLIKPAGTSRWQLPKGHINQGEKSPTAAVREVFEETGTKAEVLEKIGDIRYYFVQDKERIFKTVSYFLMSSKGEEPNIQEEWMHEVDEVSWIPSEDALKKLTFKDERKILEKAIELRKVVRAA